MTSWDGSENPLYKEPDEIPWCREPFSFGIITERAVRAQFSTAVNVQVIHLQTCSEAVERTVVSIQLVPHDYHSKIRMRSPYVREDIRCGMLPTKNKKPLLASKVKSFTVHPGDYIAGPQFSRQIIEIVGKRNLIRSDQKPHKWSQKTQISLRDFGRNFDNTNQERRKTLYSLIKRKAADRARLVSVGKLRAGLISGISTEHGFPSVIAIWHCSYPASSSLFAYIY